VAIYPRGELWWPCFRVALILGDLGFRKEELSLGAARSRILGRKKRWGGYPPQHRGAAQKLLQAATKPAKVASTSNKR